MQTRAGLLAEARRQCGLALRRAHQRRRHAGHVDAVDLAGSDQADVGARQRQHVADLVEGGDEGLGACRRGGPEFSSAQHALAVCCWQAPAWAKRQHHQLRMCKAADRCGSAGGGSTWRRPTQVAQFCARAVDIVFPRIIKHSQVARHKKKRDFVVSPIPTSVSGSACEAAGQFAMPLTLIVGLGGGEGAAKRQGKGHRQGKGRRARHVQGHCRIRSL